MKLPMHEENHDESEAEMIHPSNNESGSTGEESPALAIERKDSGEKRRDKAPDDKEPQHSVG
jgi:hypothetical protein